MFYLIICIIVIIILVVKVISIRNNFERLINDVKTSQSTISNYIEQRTQCLNDALQIAKISYSKEVSGIEHLTSESKLEQLQFLGQKYPDLQSSAGYQVAISNSFKLNQQIAASKTILNANINEYNKEIALFPKNIVAKAFGYNRESLIDEENMAENKKINRNDVDFSKF